MKEERFVSWKYPGLRVWDFIEWRSLDSNFYQSELIAIFIARMHKLTLGFGSILLPRGTTRSNPLREGKQKGE